MVVVSSAYGEGFPNILAEAMATEVPCITTDVGDAAALLEDCGAVVAPRDPEALAQAISTLLVENLGARVVRGQRARKLVRKKYSMAKMVKSYRELWQFVSGANGADDHKQASPSISMGRGPATDWWGAAELAQITGGRWIDAPAEDWQPQQVCFFSGMVRAECLIIPKVTSFRWGVDLPKLARERLHACALLVDDSFSGSSSLPQLIVPSVREAVAAMAAVARRRYQGTIFAVTGSVGKSSTSTLLYHALNRLGPCAEPLLGYNVKDGLRGQTANLRDQKFAVMEVAHSALPDCGRILRPHVAVLTAIAPAHLARTGTLADLAERKASIFLGPETGGIAVLNGSIPFYERAREVARQRDLTIRTYGEHPEADVRLLDYRLGDRVVRANVLGEEIEYVLGMTGRHMAVNSLAVVAAFHAIGLDWREAVAEFGSVQPPKGRGQRYAVKLKGKSIVLIDDAYNANPASMAAALDLAAQLTPAPGGRRIAVLADMLELGANAPRYHADLAEPIVKAGIDKVYVAGQLMINLWAALPKHLRGKKVDSVKALLPILQDEICDGDIVLFKGSHETKLFSVVSALRKLDEVRIPPTIVHAESWH